MVFDERREIETSHPLHREVVGTVGRASHLVDRRDRGMPEVSERLHFALKETDLEIGYVLSAPDDLDRDGTKRAQLLGLVDDAHPARAQSTRDVEAGDVRCAELGEIWAGCIAAHHLFEEVEHARRTVGGE